jgi:hypothetical protein
VNAGYVGAPDSAGEFILPDPRHSKPSRWLIHAVTTTDGVSAVAAMRPESDYPVSRAFPQTTTDGALKHPPSTVLALSLIEVMPTTGNFID